jgi:glutamate/tyrosine decarboxylase-like PLP-dependent enzyme/2-polyprenyl-6-methoxyphenol hydroxylase-like FAD-dependent oxidoreductase
MRSRGVIQMKAVIVGAGPVGCFLAIGLRRRSFDVVVHEKSDDPRHARLHRGHSFNLTLSLRGLQALGPELSERLDAHGVRLLHRVIHQADGTVLSQPYGIAEDHHLLSIPRRALHATLVEEAERAGVAFRFGHECVRADPCRASASFSKGSVILEDSGDILVGCDGANSVIRCEMAQSGGLCVLQKRADHGYVEIGMPASGSGAHPLALAARAADPASSHDGFHIWPRGHSVLVAQPNVDGSYTTTLFLPFTSNGTDAPSFARLGTAELVAQFFCRYFPDTVELLPRLTADFHAAAPAPLRTVQCRSFHYELAVLLGDAAHTMLPFYGQGINCSFEDVRVLLDIVDRNLSEGDGRNAIRKTLVEFTAARKPPCDAIADLSQANFQELTTHVADLRFHTRSRIERELYRRHPSQFVPLYCGVAFSTTPYDAVVGQYQPRRRRLDVLCETFDPETEADRIIEAYVATIAEGVLPGQEENLGLELSVAQRKELLDLTVSHILKHQADLASGKYPASYVHDSIHVSAYEEGKRLSAALREDVVPRVGQDLGMLLSEVFDRAVASGTVHPHPGFMAHVPSGGLLQGAVGAFIAGALNRFAGVWVAAPGLIQIECNVIRWFCTLLGYDRSAFGYLTTSGSIANMMGLMCACRRREDASSAQLTVYTSDQGHFSVRKAARLIGITPSRTRVIRTRPDYTMDVDALVRCIQSDRAHGFRPACVVATAGTTNTGAIDDLVGLAAVCRQQGIWLHVDACFGGFFRITARGRAALRGIQEADSIAVDAHKSLFLPHGNSALLVRDRSNLLATFEIPDAAYLPGTPLDPELVDFCNCGPELSREIRGLTAWLPLKMHGITAFERCLDEKLDLTRYLAAELEQIPEVEVVRRHPLLLPVVTFNLREPHGAEGAGLNQRLCELICSKGRAYVTTTMLPNCGLVIRACILNHRTDRVTVDNLVADVRSAIQVLATDCSSSARTIAGGFGTVAGAGPFHHRPEA